MSHDVFFYFFKIPCILSTQHILFPIFNYRLSFLKKCVSYLLDVTYVLEESILMIVLCAPQQLLNTILSF